MPNRFNPLPPAPSQPTVLQKMRARLLELIMSGQRDTDEYRELDAHVRAQDTGQFKPEGR